MHLQMIIKFITHPRIQWYWKNAYVRKWKRNSKSNGIIEIG